MALKIFVADDDEEVVALLQALFTTAGYTVVSTTFASRLLDLLKKEKPDLLILDLMMPGIDGYSIQLSLSQDEDLKALPVIVISGLAAGRLLFEKFEQVKHFFSKPFDSKELLSMAEEILKKSPNGGT